MQVKQEEMQQLHPDYFGQILPYPLCMPGPLLPKKRGPKSSKNPESAVCNKGQLSAFSERLNQSQRKRGQRKKKGPIQFEKKKVLQLVGAPQVKLQPEYSSGQNDEHQICKQQNVKIEFVEFPAKTEQCHPKIEENQVQRENFPIKMQECHLKIQQNEENLQIVPKLKKQAKPPLKNPIKNAVKKVNRLLINFLKKQIKYGKLHPSDTQQLQKFVNKELQQKNFLNHTFIKSLIFLKKLNFSMSLVKAQLIKMLQKSQHKQEKKNARIYRSFMEYKDRAISTVQSFENDQLVDCIKFMYNRHPENRISNVLEQLQSFKKHTEKYLNSINFGKHKRSPKPNHSTNQTHNAQK